MEHHKMILVYCCGLLFILITNSTRAATDTLYPNRTLKDGDTIVSAGEIFELGFFTFENSSFWYLGIWYKKISPRTVVWVANRDVRLLDASSMLKLNDDGNLQLLSVSNSLVWSSQSSNLVTNSNPVAQLLDSGNLVIRDNISSYLIWQSFDHPGDTWLPGMKIGQDLVTGENWHLTSWKTSDDPSLGSYSVWMNIEGYPQLYNMKHESSLHQRIGYWNGLGFSGMFVRRSSDFYTFELVSNDKEIYIGFTLKNYTFHTRMILDPRENFFLLLWHDSRQEWIIYSSPLADACEQYSFCGPNGICSIDNSPACACLEGFEPKLPEQWSAADWSNGCKPQTNLTPEQERKFMRFSNLKLPDSQKSSYNTSISLEECKNFCTNNVSCTAYANIDVRQGGSGCLMWFGELTDIREAPQGDASGQDIYIKMANSKVVRELEPAINKKKSHLKVILPIVSSIVLLTFALILYYLRRKKKSNKGLVNKDQKQDSDLLFLSLNEVAKATSNFSIDNKLGQGGFGAVYKGVLEGGGDIAVKRLSKTSRQGIVEFQLICIAKLQHREIL